MRGATQTAPGLLVAPALPVNGSLGSAVTRRTAGGTLLGGNCGVGDLLIAGGSLSPGTTMGTLTGRAVSASRRRLGDIW